MHHKIHQPLIKMKKIRVFIALKLPDGGVAAIRHAQEELALHRLKMRWVKPENIHLTLKFLGDIDPSLIDDVTTAVARAAQFRAPIMLTAKGVGVFPNIKRARVIWIGVAGQVTELIDLQRDLTSRLSAIGFPPERRKFSGHLTLGRTNGVIGAGRLMKALDNIRSFASESFPIDRIIIYKSELQSSGPVYTALQTVALIQEHAQP